MTDLEHGALIGCPTAIQGKGLHVLPDKDVESIRTNNKSKVIPPNTQRYVANAVYPNTS